MLVDLAAGWLVLVGDVCGFVVWLVTLVGLAFGW